MWDVENKCHEETGKLTSVVEFCHANLPKVSAKISGHCVTVVKTQDKVYYCEAYPRAGGMKAKCVLIGATLDRTEDDEPRTMLTISLTTTARLKEVRRERIPIGHTSRQSARRRHATLR